MLNFLGLILVLLFFCLDSFVFKILFSFVMKKLLFALVLACSVSSLSANSFSDVPNNALEYQAIDILSNQGIINGYSNGTFGGMNKVTRAELSKIFLVAADVSIQSGYFSKTFYDVPTDAWFYDYVHTAAEEGIVDGYPHGAFMPSAEVNTAEFLKMLIETFGLEQNISHTYTDVSVADWFSVYAGTAQKKDLFPLRTTNQLDPARSMTRYEVVYALYKILNFQATTTNNDYLPEDVMSSSEPNYQPLSQTTSATNCTVESSQLCVEDKTLYQNLIVSPGMSNVVVSQYRLFSPESAGRFASFEILTNSSPDAYPSFWLEQDGQQLSSKKILNGSRLELAMDKNRFNLGNNQSLTLKMDVPAGMAKNDFIKVRVLYLDNVWQNQTGDIGQTAEFGGKLQVQ
jgi:hypothetical protein